jgi:hypothetical protein
MTTEEPQQEAAAGATEVGIKVSSMREQILAGAGAALKTTGPGGSASASASGAAAAAAAPAGGGGGGGRIAVAKNMAGVFARQMMKSSWIAQVRPSHC